VADLILAQIAIGLTVFDIVYKHHADNVCSSSKNLTFVDVYVLFVSLTSWLPYTDVEKV
jgi:hypothetical protein